MSTREEDLKELSELYSAMTSSCEKYNILAKKLNLGERAAYITQSFEPPFCVTADDWKKPEAERKWKVASDYRKVQVPEAYLDVLYESRDEVEVIVAKLNDDKSLFDYDQYAADRDYFGGSIEAPGAYEWFPSSIC